METCRVGVNIHLKGAQLVPNSTEKLLSYSPRLSIELQGDQNAVRARSTF